MGPTPPALIGGAPETPAPFGAAAPRPRRRGFPAWRRRASPRPPMPARTVELAAPRAEVRARRAHPDRRQAGHRHAPSDRGRLRPAPSAARRPRLRRRPRLFVRSTPADDLLRARSPPKADGRRATSGRVSRWRETSTSASEPFRRPRRRRRLDSSRSPYTSFMVPQRRVGSAGRFVVGASQCPHSKPGDPGHRQNIRTPVLDCNGSSTASSGRRRTVSARDGELDPKPGPCPARDATVREHPILGGRVGAAGARSSLPAPTRGGRGRR